MKYTIGKGEFIYRHVQNDHTSPEISSNRCEEQSNRRYMSKYGLKRSKVEKSQ